MDERTVTGSIRQKRSAVAALRPRDGSAILAPKILTAPEVCEYLRVSRATLYRLLRDRDIPGFRVSTRDWRVAVDDLAHWIERESENWKSRRKHAREPL
jgi:excisionase family DNA binding protein